jgi:hypothetical protein
MKMEEYYLPECEIPIGKTYFDDFFSGYSVG